MIYSRERGLSLSFFNRSKGISLVVAWTFPLPPYCSQARACPFKSARLLYLNPHHKFISDQDCTVRLYFPFVCPDMAGHKELALNP